MHLAWKISIDIHSPFYSKQHMYKKNNYLKKIFALLLFTGSWMVSSASAGDTTVVQTLRFDSTMRSGMFLFPDDSTKRYEKITMLYSMRCKNGLISTGSQRNLGCGEWDYNCYTYLVDSSQTDSLFTRQASHVITNFTGTTYPYTAVPVWTYYQSNQQEVTYTSVISESTANVGAGNDTLTNPLGTSHSVSRSQYLWTAAELTGAGLTGGNITSLRLDILSLGSNLDNLKIRIKHTAATALNPDSPDLNGFTEVYYLSTALSATGLQSFNFSTPFNWNGSSNLLVEFCYSNTTQGTDNEVAAHAAGFDAAMTTTGPDAYLKFNGNISYMKVNTSLNDSIDDQISIAFWAYGDPAKLPAQTSVMEAFDASGNRQLNIHFPWSDSQIYWDCGNNGTGYDRINKVATVANFEGQWNFWVFTKNATTGFMRVFLNGVQWNSGSGKTKHIDIARFEVGRAINGSFPYYGNVDELSIWNKELNATAIQQIMNQSISPSHPDYAHLLAYYKFNEDSGMTAYDSSPNAFNSQLFTPSWRHHQSTTLFRNFIKSPNRPNTTFVKGVYTTNVVNHTILDSTQNDVSSMIRYAVTGNTLNVIDTLLVWPAGYTYVYDTAGTKIDSIAVLAQDTANITTLSYYRKRPMRLELLNFITPYGIYLDLDGLNGKTWEFDVTDFAPVLKGSKFLVMEDGKYQEENDIKFVFTEGTPPRDVKSIQNIWPNGSWVFPSYNEIVNNNYFEPRSITLDTAASRYKIRSAISGHGQEGEFIPRIHTVSVNGTTNYSRYVWTSCAANPIYPQGGTWIYDRAGWCPGAAVVLKEFEMTTVTPGQTVTLDYSLPANPSPAAGASTYRVNNQLVSYGAPNFTLDATIDTIKTPSNRTEFIRLNPICNTPLITIKNTGSTTITSLDITYGRVGAALSTFHWTGSLGFLQKQDVSLPAPQWLGTSSNRFVAYVSNPNGGVDQYGWNDTSSTDFNIPVQLPSALVFELHTNNLGNESSYTLKDSQGNLIINRTGLSSQTYYRDTVYLNTDCYTLKLNDAGDDGLFFWANPSTDTGTFKILDPFSGTVFKNYEYDFGNNIYEQFTVNYLMNTYVAPAADVDALTVFPNPTNGSFTVRFDIPVLSAVKVKMYNALMQEVLSEKLMISTPAQNFLFDTQNLAPGVYLFVADAGGKKLSTKVMVTK